jgi:hypothetical protein
MLCISNLSFSQEDSCEKKLEELLKTTNIAWTKLNKEKDSLVLLSKAYINNLDAYKRLSFDDLVLLMTPAIIERDKMLLKDLPYGEEVINYFKAKELLNSMFNKEKINKFRDPLKSSILAGTSSTELKLLFERLGYYESRNNGLIELIKKIIDLDKKNLPTSQERNENLEKRHRERIGGELFIFYFNYDYKAEEYPYLQHIIEELIKRKAGNIFADISDLLGKL